MEIFLLGEELLMLLEHGVSRILLLLLFGDVYVSDVHGVWLCLCFYRVIVKLITLLSFGAKQH